MQHTGDHLTTPARPPGQLFNLSDEEDDDEVVSQAVSTTTPTSSLVMPSQRVLDHALPTPLGIARPRSSTAAAARSSPSPSTRTSALPLPSQNEAESQRTFEDFIQQRVGSPSADRARSPGADAGLRLHETGTSQVQGLHQPADLPGGAGYDDDDVVVDAWAPFSSSSTDRSRGKTPVAGTTSDRSQGVAPVPRTAPDRLPDAVPVARTETNRSQDAAPVAGTSVHLPTVAVGQVTAIVVPTSPTVADVTAAAHPAAADVLPAGADDVAVGDADVLAADDGAQQQATVSRRKKREDSNFPTRFSPRKIRGMGHKYPDTYYY